MPIHLQLSSVDGMCRVVDAGDSTIPAVETTLADLPAVEVLRADPFAAGRALFAALGGEQLRRRLDKSDGILLLECDDATQTIPWEYAATSDQLLACEYGLLRLEPRNPLPVRQGAPRLLVLCADPLVYPSGATPAYRLDFPAELRALRQALEQGQHGLHARRVPPVEDTLIAELMGVPALVHFSCHGRTVLVQGPCGAEADAALQLEDPSGGPSTFMGSDLRARAPRGSLRLVLLSACQSAPLARALVRKGVPVALGMQHNFPDPHSDELAAEFYRALAAGHDVAEASRLARFAIARANPGAAGLLVVYTCRNAWGALELPAGAPNIELGPPGDIRLPPSLLAGDGDLLGRDAVLAELARAFDDKTTAVTITGIGGIGKTTLARAFLRRFGWRFGRVLGVTFAAAPVDLARVCRELLEQMGQRQSAQAAQDEAEQQRVELLQTHRARLRVLEQQRAAQGIQTPPHVVTEIAQIERALAELDAAEVRREAAGRLVERVLAAVRPSDLILFDNYESVLNPLPDDREQADAIQQLLRKLIGQDARLLLTSRTQPAGLRGEVLFPSDQGLGGLTADPAVELFLQHATRARGGPAEQHRQVAAEVARLTGGHPLAIVLLAGAYDAHDTGSAEFLAAWPDMLARATNHSLDPHHITITVAIERSLAALSEEQRGRLIALSRYDVPFFAEAAALLWDLPRDDGDPTDAALQSARADLALLVRRSLLMVHGTFEGTDDPATYRFQPVLHQELRRRGEAGAPPAGYAAYGAWLARRAYGEIDRSGGLANLVYQSLPLLDAAIATLDGEARLWHIRLVAWLRQQYGELMESRTMQEEALNSAPAGSHVRSVLAYQLANIYQVQGDLARAIQLYQDCLEICENLGDVQGKSATLAKMAGIYNIQGDLARAMQLYQDSLEIQEQLGDVQGKSDILHAIANIYTIQGDFAHAMQLYQDNLDIDEKLGDIRAKSATQRKMAGIYQVQGDFARAMRLYQDSLKISEKLGDVQGKSNTLHAMASIYQVQGDLARAMQLYQDSLKISEKLGDVQGKSNTLHAMAGIYQVQGDLARAMQLYQDNLEIQEKLSDVRGKSNTLYKMAYIYRAQGDFARAMQLYQDSLEIQEQLGDVRSKSATLHAMAYVYQVQGDLARAMQLYQDNLDIDEKLGDVRSKSATLHAMAGVYLVQGDFARAMQLYQDNLDIDEKLGDVRSKSATLHDMAYIYQVQGDFARAMQLYQDNLEIQEQLGDVQGKGATLHEMAYIYRAQGDFARAMQLYQNSLEIKEQLGDVQGKGATLHDMAYIYRAQGDLARAMQLYQDSLKIDEKLGDVRAKSNTLSEVASLHMQNQDWDAAVSALQEALAIVRRLQDQSSIAFNMVKLGQVDQAQGDRDAALARYHEGLAIFERLGMPRESAQVRELIAQLDAMSAETPSLRAAIAAWIAGGADDAARTDELIALLNACASAAITRVRAGDTAGAAELADVLVPLRTALQAWPPAADLPPFNAFFGCLQALLRGQHEQLARLRARLDPGLADALARVEQLVAGEDPAPAPPSQGKEAVQ